MPEPTINQRRAVGFSLMFAALAILINATFTSTRGQSPNRARDLVKSAAEAMGGEQNLRLLRSLKFEGIGHQNFLEQSERPEGPYIVMYRQISELRDLANNRLRRTTEAKFGQFPNWTSGTSIVADGIAMSINGERKGPGRGAMVQEAEEIFALAPERVLLTALDAKDLRVEADKTLQGVENHVVAFTWRGVVTRVYLNANTGLPTAIECVRSYPNDFFWGVWGDVTKRTYLSYWDLQVGGLRYPRQWDLEVNGMPSSSFTITSMKLDADVPAESFAIPAEIASAFRAAKPQPSIADLPLGRPDRPAVEVAPGIVQIPGFWNVALVKQDDGIVIIEAPISSGYSAKVIDEAKRRFPNLRIKGVVSTSDAWPHFGGIREYIARGIPTYVLDLNKPIVDRLLASKHSLTPDTLEQSPRHAKLNVVSKQTVIGSGSMRIEIFPIRSETGERMLMAYFPAHQILYASDLIQRQGSGQFFMPQYLSEVVGAVEREKLDVKTVFAMHLDPTPYAEITAAIERATSRAVATGQQ